MDHPCSIFFAVLHALYCWDVPKACVRVRHKLKRRTQSKSEERGFVCKMLSADSYTLLEGDFEDNDGVESKSEQQGEVSVSVSVRSS